MSWNKLYAGMHWTARKRESDRVHLLVRQALDPDCVMFSKPVAITVTAYFKNRPMDCSNICAKMYEDGLVSWLIKDDTPKYVASMRTISRIDKKNPRVEIELVEVERGS